MTLKLGRPPHTLKYQKEDRELHPYEWLIRHQWYLTIHTGTILHSQHMRVTSVTSGNELRLLHVGGSTRGKAFPTLIPNPSTFPKYNTNTIIILLTVNQKSPIPSTGSNVSHYHTTHWTSLVLQPLMIRLNLT